GFLLTPNALAAGDVSAEAKKFMVVMNAATSIIITKSPYMIRTSVTLPQVMETFGTWAATKGGLKQNYTMVTDYGPGHDAEAAFQSAFKAAGGTIVGSVRFPVANPDFSAFVQRAKDLAPVSIDPETRDVVQDVYIRRVQKVGNEYVNVPFDKITAVKDPAGERRKQK